MLGGAGVSVGSAGTSGSRRTSLSLPLLRVCLSRWWELGEEEEVVHKLKE